MLKGLERSNAARGGNVGLRSVVTRAVAIPTTSFTAASLGSSPSFAKLVNVGA